MEAIEILNFLENILRNNIKLEDKKYDEIIRGSITSNLYFETDYEILNQSYESLKDSCYFISQKLLLDINNYCSVKIISLKEEGFDEIFKQTNLHHSNIINLSENFIKLIEWAYNLYTTLEQYNKDNLSSDIKNCLNVTFHESPDILQEVLLNHNIFDSEQQIKALEILDNLLDDNEDEYFKLNNLISKQIAYKASEYLNNISYQYILKLQDRDFKIHRYDEMKRHPLFVNLF